MATDIPKGTPPPVIEDENRRLRRAVEELSILNDLARAIGGVVNSQEIMHTIIHRSVRAIHAEQGVITMVDQQGHDAMKTLVRTMVTEAGHQPFHFSQALLGWMQLHRMPITLNAPREDARFRGVHWDESIHSLLCVPLMVKGEVRGVLTVYNKKTEGGFTDDDQRLLAIIAGQSAQVIENARLYESEQALLRMKEEIRLAGQIQADLLPKVLPEVPGYDIAGRTIPAQDVGGDYFDFIPMESQQLGVCLGDVSGKGLPASLLMANVQATLRSQSLLNPPPQLCIQRANTLLLQSTSPEKFVTLFYAVLNTMNHTLTYVNAGHEHPFLFTSDPEPVRLSTGGAPLSIIDKFPFEEQTVSLAPDDLLVVFSDGVSEAMNAEQAQFGQSRLGALLPDLRHDSASVIIERIIEAVRTHAGGAPQNDDITLVVLKRRPS
ncbi:MAG: sigma-B regulation protein RsbU (phosphoserine phosphatase) [Bacteroidetes bacterium]|jgi:sigma-B regulation protein RsbU (phosphoserine phosphatase)|nr:sigma-B regulation protein RsbU (phosphoserine phosphatase) [Bacteroidota bacterium]